MKKFKHGDIVLAKVWSTVGDKLKYIAPHIHEGEPLYVWREVEFMCICDDCDFLYLVRDGATGYQSVLEEEIKEK